MDRRGFLRRSVEAAGVLALNRYGAVALPRRGPTTDPSTPPNMLWIFGDQHRSFAIGCNGDANVHTPNMDILSGTGVNFDHAVSSFPLCCPFRGSLLTGRYAHHCVPGHEYPLPAGQATIAAPFRQAGYQTAYWGKWHLDGFHEREGRAAMHIVPPERRGGFDVWVGYENNNSQWDCWVHGGTGKEAFHYRLPGYETDELTNLLLKYLKDRGEEAKTGPARPFFAVLSVEPPHDPNVAPADFARRYNGGQLQLRRNVPAVAWVEEQARRELAGYYAQIENWDWNIGRIRKALNDYGLAFNTYVLLFSDHGDLMGSHGQFRKTSPYEESIRIPMILGGGVPYYEGNRHGRPRVPFNSVDIAPTTLGLCSIRKPTWMEGRDYSHYRVAKSQPEIEPDSAFLEEVIPTGHPDSVNKPWRGLVTQDGWKYCCLENTSWLMFNLNEDPYEEVNLAHNNKFRAERQKLIERLKQWISDTGDKFPVPQN